MHNTKNILIFGGGINQLTLIDACNSLGYKSVVIDPSEDAPGRNTAAMFYCVEPNDYEGTKRIAIESSIHGIATSQMENPLRMMAKLAAEFGFRFNKPEIIEQSLDKYFMKQCFVESKVPHAKGKLFNNKREITKESLSEYSFPVILKPVDAHSSRGVFRIENQEKVNAYIDETLSFSRKGAFLIEEFIEGKEYSVEAVTFNGKTTIVQYTEKYITEFPYVVELGHVQPAALTIDQKINIDLEVCKAINALGLDNTVTHTELIMDKEKPVIIEVGPRMGGDFISSYLTKYSSGVDLDKATIQMAVGVAPDLGQKVQNYSFVKYLTLPSLKKIKRINDMRFLDADENIIFWHSYLNKNDVIPEIKHSANRHFVFVITAKTRTELNLKAEIVEAEILKNIEFK